MSEEVQKPPEQMSPDELIAASNVVRMQEPAPVAAADDVAGLQPGQPPVAPPLPDGFSEFETKPDGTVHAKLVSGEVFDGPMMDAFQKLGASKVATNKSYAEMKVRLDAIPAPPAAPEVIEQRQVIANTLAELPPEQFAELYYQKLNDPAEATAIAMARALGYDNADEMKQDFIDMKSATEVQRAQQIGAQFERECPEFPFTPAAADKLYGVLAENKMAETLGNLKMAHAFCVQNKLYAPRSADDIATSRGGKPATAAVTSPPPMLPPQNQTATTTNFANMTSDQIAEEYRKLKQTAATQ